MLALRLARSAALKSATAQRRSLVTATVNHVDVSSAPQTATSSRVAPIPLSNIEAQWAKLSALAEGAKLASGALTARS